jgi:hypothetical protein
MFHKLGDFEWIRVNKNLDFKSKESLEKFQKIVTISLMNIILKSN